MSCRPKKYEEKREVSSNKELTSLFSYPAGFSLPSGGPELEVGGLVPVGGVVSDGVVSVGGVTSELVLGGTVSEVGGGVTGVDSDSLGASDVLLLEVVELVSVELLETDLDVFVF